jgi:probable rRNA maturation factor
MLGDVVISLDTAARVARAERRPVGDELDRYLVHGILHLLGFDHETEGEARAMAAREDDFLRGHGMVTGAAPAPPRRTPSPAPPSRARAGARPKPRPRSRARPRSGTPR